MGTNFISRIIPLRTFHYFNGYRNAEESVNLLQACYENPLFEEDGTVIGDTHTKIHGQPDALHSKQYDIHHPAQTSVHYRQTSPKRKKRLYILGVIVAILAIIAIVTVIVVSQRDKDDGETTEKDQVLYRTQIVDGRIRIYKGPFSTFKMAYTDPSSEIYSLFASSFTYQMDYVFNHSAEYSRSFSHTEIVNISSGSVVVEFVLRFRHAIDIYHQSPSRIASVIRRGMLDSVFVIDPDTIYVGPKDPALSVITTPTPGVCLPLFSMSCTNVTAWSLTTFPNILGHTNPHEVLIGESQHQELFHYPCGKDFWCTVFNPKCHRNRALPPCKSYCKNVFSKCGGQYMMTDIHALLDCENLPDTENPDVCTPDPYKESTCLPNADERCAQFGYSEIIFPNFAGHRNPYQAASFIEVWQGINFATSCYKHAMLFTCAALMPECIRTGGVKTSIPPCKSLCNDFKAGCEIFMNVFFYEWPKPLLCDSFPDVDDPTVCIGFKEAHEPILPTECAIDEARCDNSTCYPLKWKCDDYSDCQDGTDEMPFQTSLPLRKCAVCPDDMFRCTPRSTICLENARRCDGVEDCPTGSDERECLMLGDGGSRGTLTVYNPLTDAWQPVCWDGKPVNFSNTVCIQLGYMSATSTTWVTMDTTVAYSHVSPINESNPFYAQSGLGKGVPCTSRRMISITCGIQICGIRPAYVPPSMRIVGGELADPEAWPWQVSIHGGANLRYFCGGSIIADRWILTASHCIGGRRDTSDIVMRVGQPRRGTYSPYLQELHAEKLYPYPYYNSANVDNDLALIKVRETIKFNDHVRPVCLPPTNDSIQVGTVCTVIGWGKRNETAFDYQRELKQVQLPVVEQDDCRRRINGAERQVPYRLNEHMFCAGGGLGHDACSGDSGGPLLCPMNGIDDRWYTAGVVSWGVGCAYPNVPGVYTNLPIYLDWIRNTTGLDYL